MDWEPINAREAIWIEDTYRKSARRRSTSYCAAGRLLVRLWPAKSETDLRGYAPVIAHPRGVSGFFVGDTGHEVALSKLT